MADLQTIINRMQADGSFSAILNNPLAQFGTPGQTYVGATILPERLVPQNQFDVSLVRQRTVIANSGHRYAPSQMKGRADSVAFFNVRLGAQDIMVALDPVEYDALVAANAGGNENAVRQMLAQFIDLRVNRALIELSEKERWEAIVAGSVLRKGQNGISETITYPNPAGHRVAVADDWTSDAFDPFNTILDMARFMGDKGVPLERIITSGRVISILAANAKVAARTGVIQVSSEGVLTLNANASTNIDAMNQTLRTNGLPTFEIFDGGYWDEDQTFTRFLPEDAMVFVGRGGQDAQLLQLEATGQTRVIQNPLGYTAIGRAEGQLAPGRMANVAVSTFKPLTVTAEGFAESLPVITVPEALGVLTGIGVEAP